MIIFVVGPIFTIIPIAEYFNEIRENGINIALFSLYLGINPLPGVFETHPMTEDLNGPLWTLKVEAVCYMFVAFIGMSCMSKWWHLILAVMYFTIFYELIFYPTTLFEVSFLYGGGFFLGSLMYIHREYIKLDKKLLVLSILVIGTLSIGNIYFLPAYLLSSSYIVIYIAYAKIDLSIFSKYGDFSYGIYIYHFPTLQICAIYFLPRDNSFLPYVICSFVATLILAAMSWHFVEKHALKLKKKIKTT